MRGRAGMKGERHARHVRGVERGSRMRWTTMGNLALGPQLESDGDGFAEANFVSVREAGRLDGGREVHEGPVAGAGVGDEPAAVALVDDRVTAADGRLIQHQVAGWKAAYQELAPRLQAPWRTRRPDRLQVGVTKHPDVAASGGIVPVIRWWPCLLGGLGEAEPQGRPAGSADRVLGQGDDRSGAEPAWAVPGDFHEPFQHLPLEAPASTPEGVQVARRQEDLHGVGEPHKPSTWVDDATGKGAPDDMSLQPA
jgi:hypothetical protein